MSSQEDRAKRLNAEGSVFAVTWLVLVFALSFFVVTIGLSFLREVLIAGVGSVVLAAIFANYVGKRSGVKG